jgi:hypothetical protein
MFINTKKCIRIVADNGTKFEAKAGWIGEVPQWVEEHWYFKALCKDGTVTAIVKNSKANAATQPVTEEDADPKQPNDAVTELAALRARAAELKIPRSSNLGRDKLIAAIAEAEAKLQKSEDKPVTEENPDPLADMDAAALRQFAESNSIDISGVAEDASADILREVIKAASGGD